MRVYYYLTWLLWLQEVRDKYAAVVKMLDSGDKLKLDQNHVETVIPAPGKPTVTTNSLRCKHQAPQLFDFFFSNLVIVM